MLATLLLPWREKVAEGRMRGNIHRPPVARLLIRPFGAPSPARGEGRIRRLPVALLLPSREKGVCSGPLGPRDSPDFSQKHENSKPRPRIMRGGKVSPPAVL